jgi:eukaryotic-like serine/threonine-protein kinase
MIGQTISHYRILERLGEGGMGTVYKAHDEKLDRLVAVKVLSTRTETSPEDLLRFEQEAKAIAALSHPHIATIYDRGHVDGRPFLVLEYISGGTLREKLRSNLEPGGPLAAMDLLRYAVEASEALAHAHRRGVIHRDVKTDNLILTEEGHVKVTDFGLAKWTNSARITSQGSMLGTAAYMSPEQAQGVETDARSDVFSLGVVLFELATSKPPFEGLYPAAVVYDIIHTPTPSVLERRPDLPRPLEKIIHKAMAKSPQERYQSMEDLLADLEALRDSIISGSGNGPAILAAQRSSTRRRARLLASAAVLGTLLVLAAGWRVWKGGPSPFQGTPAASSGVEAISIAVLPLENLSNDPTQEYLADGMTEALITDLAKTGGFRVISRTSVMQYKGSTKSLREIAGELNVNRVVEGSVLQVGDEIRITAQLIDAATDEHLWAQSYQERLTDVLSLQQKVAQSIAAEVSSQLSTRAAISRPPRPVNPRAYEQYLRGRQLAFQWSPQSIEQGIGHYQEAINIDPNYADAYAGLAMAYGLGALFGDMPAAELWPRARAAAERALEIDDTTGDAHTALGFVMGSYDWNWYGAEKAFRRAIELNPGSSVAHHAYAMICLAPLGRLDEALAEIEKARDLDPLSPSVNLNVADVYYFREDYDTAIRLYKETIEQYPSFPKVREWLGNTYYVTGKYKEAAEYYQQAMATQTDRNPFPRVAHLIVTGRHTEARHELEQLTKDPEAARVLGGEYTVLYGMLGDKEVAFKWLEQAYLDRSGRLTFVKVSPMFDMLRPDPRFQSLLQRMSLDR